jgi:magnesium transporter
VQHTGSTIYPSVAAVVDNVFSAKHVMHVSSPPTRFEPDSAIGFATIRVPVATAGETAADVLSRISRAERYDTVADIAVVEGDRLRGLVSIEDLLAASPLSTAESLMDPDPPIVSPGMDQEVAAAKAVSHGESSLAVVDDEGRFVGLIPAHRMLGVLIDEHHEDLARLSGYMHQTESARAASQEGLGRRLWHRFPWLAVGLAAAMLAAAIVAGFEEELAARIELAFFIPGIVYIADAVGTQTEVLVVRGLSVGVSVRNIVGRELATGVALGAILGGIAYFPILIWVDKPVALAVSASIWAASAVATLVAMSLPWLLSKVGMDPAFGSGPLATVAQDLLSLLIYFGFAAYFVL